MGYKYNDLDYEASRQKSSDVPGRVYLVETRNKIGEPHIND